MCIFYPASPNFIVLCNCSTLSKLGKLALVQTIEPDLSSYTCTHLCHYINVILLHEWLCVTIIIKIFNCTISVTLQSYIHYTSPWYPSTINLFSNSIIIFHKLYICTYIWNHIVCIFLRLTASTQYYFLAICSWVYVAEKEKFILI